MRKPISVATCVRREHGVEMNDDGAWVGSDVLDGYSYEEGMAVIAACNWASLAED